ncbi:MAG: metal-dependent hydrolase [Chloroflexi bacterium]|nr:metal-dependent hydrolase [Chloroflexota bacterium]
MLFFGHTGITLGIVEIFKVLRLGPIDYRMVLLGSLLPDIIDKPLGMIIFANMFSNGRIFGHTLIFIFVLLAVGVYLFWKVNKTWGLVLAYGSIMHLIFDEMWSSPRTILWPLYGWVFPRGDITNWLGHLIHSLFNNPHDYIPELVGATILAHFLFNLVRRQKVVCFMKKGRVELAEKIA